MKTYRSLFTLVFLVQHLCAQTIVPYYIQWDDDMAPAVAAQDILTVHQEIYRFTERHLPISFWDESQFGNKLLGMGFRLSKSLLLDFQVDHVAHVLQHEAFGHGFRFREFGVVDNSFQVNLAPPFGPAGGSARLGTFTRGTTLREAVMMNAGGVEAAAVLSQQLKTKWVQRGTIHYRESLLYMSSLLDATYYAWITHWGGFSGSGNDVRNYIRNLNRLEGFNDEETFPLSVEDLARRSTINLLNTHLWLAAYTFFKRYVYEGEKTMNLPMIRTGDVRWLPAVRFGLAPYGTEWLLEGDVIFRDASLLKLSLRAGDGVFGASGGVSAHYISPMRPKEQWQFRIAAWQQPELDLHGSSVVSPNSIIGLLGAVAGSFHLGPHKEWGIYIEGGYKTKGYFEGERLRQSPILRIGLVFNTPSAPASHRQQ